MKQFILFSVFLFFISLSWSCSDSVTTNSTEEILSEELIQQQIDSIKIAEQKKSKPLIPAVRKCIYLTIDDGPLNGAKYIDSIVTEKKVKTNLFVVGNSVDGSGRFKKYFENLQTNPYVEMYNHSYCHANNKYTNYYKQPDLVVADFEKNESKLSLSHKVARLPGRNLWQLPERSKNLKQTGATSAQLLVDNGYRIYGWDVEWKYNPSNYGPKQTINELIEEINIAYHSNKTFTPQHVVLLMHDQMFARMDEKNDLGELISKLQENDFTFEYISAYPDSFNNDILQISLE